MTCSTTSPCQQAKAEECSVCLPWDRFFTACGRSLGGFAERQPRPDVTLVRRVELALESRRGNGFDPANGQSRIDDRCHRASGSRTSAAAIAKSPHAGSTSSNPNACFVRKQRNTTCADESVRGKCGRHDALEEGGRRKRCELLRTAPTTMSADNASSPPGTTPWRIGIQRCCRRTCRGSTGTSAIECATVERSRPRGPTIALLSSMA